MRCLNCGCEVPEESRFCVNCGAPIQQENYTYGGSNQTQSNSQWKPIYTLVVIFGILFLLILTIGIGVIVYTVSNNDPVQVNNGTQEIQKETIVEQEDEEEEEAEEEKEVDEKIIYIRPYYAEDYVYYHGDFVLPNSGSEYISKYDLYGMSKWECKIARNEIYARHGRMFNDDALQDYFDGCAWYVPLVRPKDFKEGMLNKYEKKNVQVIVAYEKEMGYR